MEGSFHQHKEIELDVSFILEQIPYRSSKKSPVDLSTTDPLKGMTIDDLMACRDTLPHSEPMQIPRKLKRDDSYESRSSQSLETPLDPSQFSLIRPMKREGIEELKEVPGVDFYDSLMGEMEEAIKGIFPEDSKLKRKVTEEELHQDVENSSTDSMIRLGDSFFYGKTQDKDPKKAEEWYTKAAEKGDPKGFTQLGMLKKEEGKMSQAAALFLWASENHNPEAYYQIGLLYQQGVPFGKDSKKMFEYTLKAATRGHAKAINRLALMNLNGEGTDRCYTTAFRNFNKAIKQGCVDAINNIAFMYEKGWGVEKSDKDALQWYHFADYKGNKAASYHLGLIYEQGRGDVERDLEVAKNYFTKGADRGCPKSSVHLAQLHIAGGDKTNAEMRLKSAIEQGSAQAKYLLGMLMRESDFQGALELCSSAVEDGYTGRQPEFDIIDDCLY